MYKIHNIEPYIYTTYRYIQIKHVRTYANNTFTQTTHVNVYTSTTLLKQHVHLYVITLYIRKQHSHIYKTCTRIQSHLSFNMNYVKRINDTHMHINNTRTYKLYIFTYISITFT